MRVKHFVIRFLSVSTIGLFKTAHSGFVKELVGVDSAGEFALWRLLRRLAGG